MSYLRNLSRGAFVAGLASVLAAGCGDNHAVPTPDAGIGASYPLRFGHEVESALAYVEHPAARAAHEATTRISDAHRGGSVLLSRLRAHLGGDPSAPTLDGAAGSLGMSTRMLQRELARLDTSFSEELRRVRIAAAESLLIHSDLKIDAIVLKLGFGTASRMSATLRRERNVTASGLRGRFRS